MLNLNLNTLYTNRVTIEPILSNTFNYFLIGGGGGGAAGQAGGKGGEGGDITTGSFNFPHLSTVTLEIGGGGVSGVTINATGDNGVSSSLSNDSGLVAYASGGLANFNSTGDQNFTQVGLDYDFYNSNLWGGDGTKGADSPAGVNGVGGGSGEGNNFPWTTNPSPTTVAGLVHTGGGAGGFKSNEFNGGGNLNGASGLAVLSFLDPRDVFDYTGDWDAFYYLDGRKYFYWLRVPTVSTVSVGTFTFLGKRG